MSGKVIVECSFERHAQAILDIFNEAIENSTALYDYKPRALQSMVGWFDAANAGSIALHEKLGFKHAGTLPQVGFKFGRWLDLAFYQLLLDTPATPVDG